MQRRNFFQMKFIVGVTCLTLILVLAIFGHVISGHDATEQDLMSSLQPPGLGNGGYYLGTDHLGRDILARMASGARVSIVIAMSIVLISGVFGVLYGTLSGYWGGIRDVALQKVVETFWAFPPILLALAILAFFGQSLGNIIIALAIQRWIPYCRIARAQAMVLRNREFVSAAKIMGGGTGWIVTRHILPNVLASAIVIATFSMAGAILAEASLSFLGLGVPPEVPTWGGMLAEGRSYVVGAWWIAVFPGLGIFFTVLGLNLLGDWLRDLLDPKSALNLR
jgi:peptide/nickel transport system permease protein